jgi:hypothetical protein
VALATTGSAGRLGHDCLHCACAADSASMIACDEACWTAIACIAEHCTGNAEDTACIRETCGAGMAESVAVKSASSALSACSNTCPLAAGAPSTPGRSRGPSPDDVYVLAACERGLTVSSCGTSEFAAVIDLRPRSLEAPAESCSEQIDMCDGDGLGAAVVAYPPLGLTFIVVDGVDESALGPYQLAVTY